MLIIQNIRRCKTMVREIIKDTMFLSQKAREATTSKEDIQTAEDLMETLDFHKEHCIGLAGNMIGENVSIIAYFNAELDKDEVIFNPKIVKSSEGYTTNESCLSLTGEREIKRYKSIKLEYQVLEKNTKGEFSLKKRVKNFNGLTAQIIQHEIDHTNGVII